MEIAHAMPSKTLFILTSGFHLRSIRIPGFAQALKDLHANSILAVLDTEEQDIVEARFATDLNTFLRAKTQQLCCTS